MTKKLKRCPWCGGRGLLMHWTDGTWSVSCPSGGECPIVCPETRIHKTRKAAIKAWEDRK